MSITSKPPCQPDSFDEIASEMANVHNMMVRGLNAIYLQAPHVQPSDEKHFCTFIMHWHKLIFTHHAGEEEHAFPAIEAMAGVKGIMNNNVEQHHAFHGGLETLGAYVTDCKAGKQKYDGRKIVEIIDGFGAALAEHLADEIPTLVGLRQYGEKMSGFAKMFSAEGDKAIVSVPFFFLRTSFPLFLHSSRSLARADARLNVETTRSDDSVFLLRHVGYSLRERHLD